MSTDIHGKVAEAMKVAGERDANFALERDGEANLVEDIVAQVLPVLPALCSRVEAMHGRTVFKGLEIAPRVYLDDRGRFRLFYDATGGAGVEKMVAPKELVANYGRGAVRLVAFALTQALDALIAGNSQDRTNEAKRLAEKYRAISALLRDR